MPCLVVLFALLLPRAAMVFIWLLTDWFARAYDTALGPVLGFIFLPYTTLAYMAAMLNAGALTGGWLILLIVAVLVDLSHYGGTSRIRRRP